MRGPGNPAAPTRGKVRVGDPGGSRKQLGNSCEGAVTLFDRCQAEVYMRSLYSPKSEPEWTLCMPFLNTGC